MPSPGWSRDGSSPARQHGITRQSNVKPPRQPRRAAWIATWRGAFVFAGLAVAPDLDLLFRAHSMYTHSIGAALARDAGRRPR